MKSTLSIARPLQLGRIAALCFLAAAACAPKGAGDKAGATAAPVSVQQVRERVNQYSQGGDEKDQAGEAFYNWGAAAHPALAELSRDPSLTDDELTSMIMIVAVFDHTPELFDALRTRINAEPDAQVRTMRLGLLDELQATPGVPPR
jgi:hypothetical protein